MDATQSSLSGGLRSFQRAFDPFGIADSLWQVQRGWLRHPRALGRQLAMLQGEYRSLYRYAWDRLHGVRWGDEEFPAVEWDERFQEPAWTENAWLDVLKQGYLLYTRWVEDTIFATPDLPEKTRRRAAFWTRQWLNAIAPSNFLWTNPHAIQCLLDTGGASLVRGFESLLRDGARADLRMVDDGDFEVGRNIANTPGAVVFRNELLELIQYAPATEQVHATPILLVAPWINKYYILDINEKKSLVRFLVDKGFTVFITSWKNPGGDMRHTSFDDYMLRGVLPAVSAIRSICGTEQIHAVGYCIGGTLLAALLAWLNRGGNGAGEVPIAHWTLFTALVDFDNPGDIDVFIDEESIQAVEAMMAGPGYLDGNAFAWSFRMLRSNSLVWHYWVHNHLYGEEPPPFDVLYWNTDCTRLPEAMHSFYLREFYLENRLIEPDAVTLGERPIDLGRITQPLYAVGTEQDHISPWKETFKITRHVAGPVRYVLATSGHIMGIVNPPVDPPKRRYWVGDASGQIDPEVWRSGVEKVPGSWWEDWVAWLAERNGPLVAPPHMGIPGAASLGPAPGTYVLER